jgi:chromosome partitioning protein
MRRIAIINQKGGVGKTTTAVNLSAALADCCQRVLLIDLDPQAHATLHVGLPADGENPTIYNVLTDDRPLAAAAQKVSDFLSVVGSHIDLAAAELELASVVGRELILRDRLAALEGGGTINADAAQARGRRHASTNAEGLQQASADPYDYVLIDCPPSLGVLTLNALAAVDEVLLPMQPHFLALHGMSKLLSTIQLVANRLNPRLRLSGVLYCMYDASTRLAAEVARDVDAFFEQSRTAATPWSGVQMFQTRVRRNIRLAEAPSFGQSIFSYAPDSNGAEDYRRLADELRSVA